MKKEIEEKISNEPLEMFENDFDEDKIIPDDKKRLNKYDKKLVMIYLILICPSDSLNQELDTNKWKIIAEFHDIANTSVFFFLI